MTNPAQSAEYVAVERSAIDQLLVTSDFLKCIDRLNKKHDPHRVLACVREWVRYMDRIQQIMAEHARSDGQEGSDG